MLSLWEGRYTSWNIMLSPTAKCMIGLLPWWLLSAWLKHHHGAIKHAAIWKFLEIPQQDHFWFQHEFHLWILPVSWCFLIMTLPFIRGTAYRNMRVKFVACPISSSVFRTLCALLHSMDATVPYGRYQYFVLILKMEKQKIRDFNCLGSCFYFRKGDHLLHFHNNWGLHWGGLNRQDV